MSITNLKGLRLPASIIATALLIGGAAFLVSGWFDWKPLAMPFDLNPGATRSPAFRVRQKARYLVNIEVERNMPNEDVLCLLGGVPFRPRCSIQSVVDLEWTLWSNLQEVASGNSSNAKGWGFGSTITKTIGQFEGSPGTPYVLEVVSMLDASALAAANPRIVVQVHPSVTKDRYIFSLLATIFLAPVACIGVMWLIIWAVLRAYVRPKKA